MKFLIIKLLSILKKASLEKLRNYYPITPSNTSRPCARMTNVKIKNSKMAVQR
jgi:hypothetical protein